MTRPEGVFYFAAALLVGVTTWRPPARMLLEPLLVFAPLVLIFVLSMDGYYGVAWPNSLDDSVAREEWDPRPPHVDPDGWFFSAATVRELAEQIANRYQKQPLSADALEETVATYNGYVDRGEDLDFGKPTPAFNIQTPPIYAARTTPIHHDTLSGLRITSKAEVVDREGQTIPSLYCAGESAGGFALHGLPRCTVFGRIAGKEAAAVES